MSSRSPCQRGFEDSVIIIIIINYHIFFFSNIKRDVHDKKVSLGALFDSFAAFPLVSIERADRGRVDGDGVWKSAKSPPGRVFVETIYTRK